MKEHKERPHAKLGGSSAERWSNCPGSVILEAQVPPRPTSEEALEGTRAHEALETLLKAFLSHKIHGTDWPITIDTKEQIHEIALQTVKEMWEQVLFESITDKGYGIESKLYFDKDLDVYGYVDFWCVHIDDRGKKVGIIFDFKYGFHSVQAEDNAQLAFYACALQKFFSKNKKPLDYVRGIIYQPRVDGEDPYREAVFSDKQLKVWEKKFYEAANKILIDNKPTYKTGKWCQWCRGQAKCAAYKRDLSVNDSLRVLDRNPLEDFEFPEPETIPDNEVVRIVLIGEKVKRFIDACKTYVIDRQLNGVPLEGVKLVPSSTRRKWKDEHEEIMKELWKLGAHDVSKQKLLGITVVEEQLTKMFGKREAKNILDKFTEQTQPSVKLVPDVPMGKVEILNSRKLLQLQEEKENAESDEKTIQA